MNSPLLSHESFQTPEERENLFQVLENDKQLFKETLEVMLTLIISDPKLTFDVADLIESDYRNLYLVIMKKVLGKENGKGKGIKGCCKEI